MGWLRHESDCAETRSRPQPEIPMNPGPRLRWFRRIALVAVGIALLAAAWTYSAREPAFRDPNSSWIPLAFSPDGKLLAAADATGHQRWRLEHCSRWPVAGRWSAGGSRSESDWRQRRPKKVSARRSQPPGPGESSLGECFAHSTAVMQHERQGFQEPSSRPSRLGSSPIVPSAHPSRQA
jgi:hypothetical protein